MSNSYRLCPVLLRIIKKNDVSISNRFPEVHKRGIHTQTDRQTHTHTHTYYDSIRRNAMRCISPNDCRLSVAEVHHIELGLKIRVYVIRRLAVVCDSTCAWTENDNRPARHKQYTYGYTHLTAPHSCDYMGYVRHVGHTARSSKNHM